LAKYIQSYLKSKTHSTLKVIVIGGGIIGLCSAYYLQKSGCQVTIIDKSDGSDGCSFGNAGYISPSHFTPLASPGIVAQGLKYMTSSSSPFYIKPRFNLDLMKWSLKFYQNANDKILQQNIPPLNNLLHYSREKTIEMAQSLNNTFDLQLRGCYMMYRLEKTMEHEIELAHHAKELGIETVVYNQKEIQALEPDLGITAIGAVLYPIDGHLNPTKWMSALKKDLSENGARFLWNTEMKGVQKYQNKIKGIKLNTNETMECDHLIVATGAWLPSVLSQIGIKLLLQPGKGYSTTYGNLDKNLSKPAILVDDRVAMTPWGNSLRIGGTMELSGINQDIRLPRVSAIVNAVNANFTELDLPMPSIEKIWSGLRPVSPDGLPYISNAKNTSNITIAGGHAMLGISLAAGTGKIVDDLVHGRTTEINVNAFNVNR
jgi:D-amino-acid dehydrogenase